MGRRLLVLAAVVAVGELAWLSLWPLAQGGAHGDLAVAAFGVAGTMVALVVPAASLGRDAATRTIEYYVDGAMKAADAEAGGAEVVPSAAQWAAVGVAKVSTLRARLTLARWGSGLVGAGFLLSGVSLLELEHPVLGHLGRAAVLPWHATIAAGLACLAAGTVMFLPLGWWFWDAGFAADSESLLRDLLAHPEAEATVRKPRRRARRPRAS